MNIGTDKHGIVINPAIFLQQSYSNKWVCDMHGQQHRLNIGAVWRIDFEHSCISHREKIPGFVVKLSDMHSQP